MHSVATVSLVIVLLRAGSAEKRSKVEHFLVTAPFTRCIVWRIYTNGSLRAALIALLVQLGLIPGLRPVSVKVPSYLVTHSRLVRLLPRPSRMTL